MKIKYKKGYSCRIIKSVCIIIIINVFCKLQSKKNKKKNENEYLMI